MGDVEAALQKQMIADAIQRHDDQDFRFSLGWPELLHQRLRGESAGDRAVEGDESIAGAAIEADARLDRRVAQVFARGEMRITMSRSSVSVTVTGTRFNSAAAPSAWHSSSTHPASRGEGRGPGRSSEPAKTQNPCWYDPAKRSDSSTSRRRMRGNLVQEWRGAWAMRRFIATMGFWRSAVHPEMKTAPDSETIMVSAPAPGPRARAAPPLGSAALL
jgi:hypothetical protein